MKKLVLAGDVSFGGEFSGLVRELTGGIGWGGDKAGYLKRLKAGLKSKIPRSWKCKLELLEVGGRCEVRLNVLEGDVGFWNNMSGNLWNHGVRLGIVKDAHEVLKGGYVVIDGGDCSRIFSGQYGVIIGGILSAMLDATWDGVSEADWRGELETSICVGYVKGKKGVSYKVGGRDVNEVVWGK